MCSTPRQTEAVGRAIAKLGCSKGDVILLHGGVGVGKSVFVRGYIRAALGDPDLLVPSPTFLRENLYLRSNGACSVHHIDLYRCNPEDSHAVSLRLDFGSTLNEGACLVEWPDVFNAYLPHELLAVTITEVPRCQVEQYTASSPPDGGVCLGLLDLSLDNSVGPNTSGFALGLLDEDEEDTDSEDDHIRVLELVAYSDQWAQRLRGLSFC